MPIKDETEFAVLFEFIHLLLLEEGTETIYSVRSSAIQMIADIDAKEPAKKIAAQFATSPVDSFTLPTLRDSRNHATANHMGVELTSTDKLWLQTWYRRWADCLTRPPIATFLMTKPVDPSEKSGYGRLFRSIYWLNRVATLDPDSFFQADWSRDGKKRRQWKLNEKVKPCHNCKVKHPEKMCQRVIAFVDHPAQSKQGLRVAIEYGFHTVAARVGQAKIYIKTTKLAQLETAVREWEQTMEKPWDVDLKALGDLSKPRTKLKTEIRFDERGELHSVLEVMHRLILEEGIEEYYEIFSPEGPVGRARAGEEAHNVDKRIRWAKRLTFQLPPLRSLERNIGISEGLITLSSAAPAWDADWIQTWVDNIEAALRRPLAADFVQNCEVQCYPEVTYFFLFKALAWLMEFRGEATSIRFLLSDPEERYDLPFKGPNSLCKSCGLEHPADLCVDLVNCAFLDRFLLISLDSGDAELEVRFIEKQVRVIGSDTEFCQRATEAWQKLERTPIGDP